MPWENSAFGHRDGQAFCLQNLEPAEDGGDGGGALGVEAWQAGRGELE